MPSLKLSCSIVHEKYAQVFMYFKDFWSSKLLGNTHFTTVILNPGCTSESSEETLRQKKFQRPLYQGETIIYVGWINNVLLHSTGNFIQYPVTNYKEKNIKINKTVVFNCPLPQKNLCGIPICREVRLRISIVDQ